jgi:hypothetical protein
MAVLASRPSRAIVLGSILGALAIGFSPRAPRAGVQDRSDAPNEETVANLAAGRVVIAVTKGAILVSTVENPVEAEARVPTPVAITSVRLGIILGAVRWRSPSTDRDLARLDQDLPHLHSHLTPNGPHLLDGQAGVEASDIEGVGQGLLERLSEVARNLHAKIDMPASDPLAELILVDYFPNYGPEVWQVSYGVKQEEEQAGYWTTRVLRPGYLQFWPPLKGEPRTLVEFSYPPENTPTTLLDLLRQKDPRLQKLIASDAKMADVANHFLAGDSTRVLPADATQFLRAALAAVSPADARQTMALIDQEKGFDLILAPPPEAPTPDSLPPESRPGAPTLRTH